MNPGADAAPAAGPAAAPRAARKKPHPVLEQLAALYPGHFGARFLPLKRGVFEDLLARHPEAFEREALKTALGLHARSTRYLEAVASGAMRHDLDGVPVEPVAPEHVHHAIVEVFKRRQGRTQDDLRPALRARLVAAVRASGLSREDYLLAVRSNDEAARAALDEAFAEIGLQDARHEALWRAFQASGKSLAEFADMYGLDEAEVGRSIEQARSARAATA